MDLGEVSQTLLGLGNEPKDLNLLQMGVRSVIVFGVTLVMVRVANKRFLSNMSAFDAIPGIHAGIGTSSGHQWFGGLFLDPGGWIGARVSAPAAWHPGISFED